MCVLSHVLGLGKAGDLAALASGASLLIGLVIAFFLSWLLERLEGK